MATHPVNNNNKTWRTSVSFPIIKKSLSNRPRSTSISLGKEKHCKVLDKSSNVSLNEIRAQICLNTLTKTSEIVTIIKHSNDKDVIIWASTYKQAAVRAASASSKLLPFGRLLRMIFFDASKSVVQNATSTLVTHHEANLSHLFHFIEEFPQLSLPFNIGHVVPKETTIKGYRKGLKIVDETDESKESECAPATSTDEIAYTVTGAPKYRQAEYKLRKY